MVLAPSKEPIGRNLRTRIRQQVCCTGSPENLLQPISVLIADLITARQAANPMRWVSGSKIESRSAAKTQPVAIPP